MPVNQTKQLNFLYRFEAGSAVHTFSDVALDQSYNGETYEKIQIAHTPPTFSDQPEEAELDVTIHELTVLADLFINGPPPYPIKLRIYEYDREAETVTPYYRGWITRAPFELTESLLGLHAKSVWQFFQRESLTDSLSALSRYSVYDPRLGVDLESFKVNVTIDALNETRDVLTVSGITEIDGWFSGGMIIAPSNEPRTILKHITEAGDKKLYLAAAFPEFVLAEGFTADIYPGDDLTYATWANKFAAQTNNGEAFGGWIHTPNSDPATKGVM